jgi:phage tail-like protein
MPSPAQRFESIDGRTHWDTARVSGLDRNPAGGVTLAQIPAPVEGGVDLPGPYAPRLDGFTVSHCGEIAFALPAERTIVLIDTRCADRRFVLDQRACAEEDGLAWISGLASGGGRLYAANRETTGVSIFALPSLELISSKPGNFESLARVGVDSAGRIYVLDTKPTQLLRLHPDGRPDRSYETRTVAAIAGALDLFVTADGAAFVSVADQADILHFSPSGQSLDNVLPPEEAPGFRPGALAGDSQRLYVADRASGALWVYDLAADRWLAPVPRFRAPAAGLAADGEGHLYIRTGADIQYVRLDARSASLARGRLEAGPFDAGDACAWMRVHVEADTPEGTRVRLETALTADSDTTPTTSPPWHTASSLDALVHRPEPAGIPPDRAARFLWIRVHLETDDPTRSPLLRRVVAETPGDDYLARLPAVYARNDAAGGGFLRSWLETARAELGDQELAIVDLAQRFDPATAPEDDLAWLATWLAFDLPHAADAAERRALLLDAYRLYARRGTVAGLREMVRIYAGVDCEIVESFRSRRLWALNNARLGLDTGLLAALPDGMVVPGPSLPEPSLQGLRAEYFLDDRLGTSVASPDRGGDRCGPRSADSPVVDSNGGFPSFKVPSPPGKSLDAFSVLWTGQIRARYTELYSFYFAHDGGARLYVDDQLLIDSWITPGHREPRGSLPLTAERWHVLRIEYWSRNLDAAHKLAAPKLSWSSRSQRKEIVPQECLYALSDDNINPEARRTDGGPAPMVVGDTVVGAHGPLAAEDFGAALFDDTAHRFTVRVHAAHVRRPGTLDAIRAVLDAEKPAHTDYHLCVIEPTFVVGTQARLDIDAYVAPAPPPGRYDEGRLGLDARLGISPEHDDGTLRVDETLRIGSPAILR